MKKLAIHGGKKQRLKPMPQREAFGDLEVSKLNEVVKYYRDLKIDPPYSGKFEEKFCKEFVKYMGGNGYADAVTSGTAAIYTSLRALNLPRKSEVLITAVTDCGPLNCIIIQGLTPKIVDTAKNSYNSCLCNFKKMSDDQPSVETIFFNFLRISSFFLFMSLSFILFIFPISSYFFFKTKSVFMC